MGDRKGKTINMKDRSRRGKRSRNRKMARAVRIGTSAGLDRVTEICRAAGVQSKLRQYPSTFLGSSEMTPAELCLAYTIFPNGGWRPDYAAIFSNASKTKTATLFGRHRRTKTIETRAETGNRLRGKLVPDRRAQFENRRSPPRQNSVSKNFRRRGKTGTAYDFTDALFCRLR